MSSIRTRLKGIPRFYIDIALLIGAQFVMSFGMSLFRSLLAVYMKEFIDSEQTISAILSISMFMGVTALLGGIWTKRVSLKTLVVLSWIVSLPVPLVFYFATTSAGFALGQVLTSLTTMFSPAVVLYIFDYPGAPDRTGAYLIYTTATHLAGIVAPTVGGALIEVYGYRPVLLIGFVLLCVALGMSLLLSSPHPRRVPAPKKERAARVPFGEALRNFGAMVWRRRRLWVWMLLLMLPQNICVIGEPVLSLYLRTCKGLTLTQVGLGYTVAALMGVIQIFCLNKLSKKYAPLWILGALSVFLVLANIGLQGTGVLLMLLSVWFKGSGRTVASYVQAAFSESLMMENHEMLVAGFIAVRSMLSSFTYNLGGALYMVRPELPYLVEIGALAVWFLLFALFTKGKRPTFAD